LPFQGLPATFVLDSLPPTGYTKSMKYELRSTTQYDKWFAGIKDRQARNKILRRIDSMTIGSFGDHKTISVNLFELRMFFGPGFRVYYTIQGHEIIFLLGGGDKSSQKKYITKAKVLFLGYF
jgi:putative addiction module killer protein